MKLAEKIKIGVVPKSDVSPNMLNRFLCYLREALTKCLEAISSDKSLSFQLMEPNFVVKCSACVGKNKECLRHKKQECQHDECGHFWSLEYLMNKPKHLVCEHASEIETKKFSLDRVLPWLPTESWFQSLVNLFWRRKSSEELSYRESESMAPGVPSVTEFLRKAFPEITINRDEAEHKIAPPIQCVSSQPELLQSGEIVLIARRIPHCWKEVALQTAIFEDYDVQNLDSSKVDERSKALNMLMEFNERSGTRKQLADALRRSELNDVANKVLSGYFINDAGCN